MISDHLKTTNKTNEQDGLGRKFSPHDLRATFYSEALKESYKREIERLKDIIHKLELERTDLVTDKPLPANSPFYL